MLHVEAGDILLGHAMGNPQNSRKRNELANCVPLCERGSFRGGIEHLKENSRAQDSNAIYATYLVGIIVAD
jgi:hypothetical protein